MRPLRAIVLLTLACSAERTPRHGTMTSSLNQESMAASLAAESAAAEAASYTTPWADSSKSGDITFYSKGRVVTTVAVHTDSQWVVQPSGAAGLPYGPTQLPPDSLCTLGYTGTTLPVVPGRVLRDLERTRECGGRTFVQIRRARLKDSNGHLSVHAAVSELDKWPWDALCARVKDSTILAFHIGDDVVAKEWGPETLEVRLAQWDSIAGAIAAKCPGAAIAIRARPRHLARRDNWQFLTTAWAQYPGPLPRSGSPEDFFAAEIASAKKQRLGLVTGVNLLGGGCGPAETGRCLPDVPGTSIRGRGKNVYELSAAELIYYKKVAMSDFHGRPEIQAAAKALGVIASKRKASSCVQR